MKIQRFMTESEGCWFDFIDDLRVKIKPLTRASARKIESQSSKPAYKKRQGVINEIDTEKHDNLLSKHIVADWENFQDDEGKGIPCTPENITALMNHWPEFNSFVQEVATNYQETLAKQSEESEKN